jgi:hypothetical protein
MNVLNWNVRIKPMTEHLLHLLSIPISSSFFIYFEGENMLNVLSSLLVKLTKVEPKPITKLLYMQSF